MKKIKQNKKDLMVKNGKILEVQTMPGIQNRVEVKVMFLLTNKQAINISSMFINFDDITIVSHRKESKHNCVLK